MSDGPARRLEVGSYIAVAMGAVLPALLAGHVVGDGVDMYGTFWFYWWILHCVSHLANPSHTVLFFYPLGKDIFAHTGDNFVDAVVAAPFQAVFGYPGFQPWFVAAMLIGNALTFRPLARYVIDDGWAAWGATLLWEVCPYALFEIMTGRLTQAFLWFLPPAVLAFLRIGDQAAAPDGKVWRHAVRAGVFTALQAYTYWFMGYFMALAFAWLALVAFVRGRGSRLRMMRGWLLAGAITVGLVAPAGLWMAHLAHQGAVPGVPAHSASIWSDPSLLLKGPGAIANNVATFLHGYTLLETQGQPMFAYWVWGGGLALFLLFGRDRLRWGGVIGLSLVFAVGPVWPTKTGGVVMPHYMLAYYLLPFFDRLWFPYRMVGMAMFGAALGIGTVLARARSLWVRAGRWGRRAAMALPVLLASGTMAEQHPNLAYPLLHRELTPPAVYRWIGRVGGALIELPIGLARISIAYQPVHRQPTFGGMGENAPVLWPDGYRRRLANSFIRFLAHVTREPDRPLKFNPNDVRTLVSEGFRWVVLDRRLVDADLHRWPWYRTASDEEIDQAPFMAQSLIAQALGPPAAVDGSLVVWDLVGAAQPPANLRPTPRKLTTRTWPRDEMPAYEVRLRQLGRLPESAPRPGASR